MNAETFFNNGFGEDCEKVHRNHVIELMQNYAEHYYNEQLRIAVVSGSVKPTSWRGQKCYHCESEKRNTLRDSVNIDGSEDWKCFDCGRWFKL